MASTREGGLEIREALSPARIGTYEAAVGGDIHTALVLYAWNAQVSAAFLAPLHICEVVVRNAVAAALEAKYGTNWPWSSAFEQSLPNPGQVYNPRRDLQRARQNVPMGHVGKVIPELKFAFWQSMFTKRHDTRIWDLYLKTVLPNLDAAQPVAQLREALFNVLEVLRKLRNRVAHHEPIFTRDLRGEFAKICDVVCYQSWVAAEWMLDHQQVETLLAAKPGHAP